MDTVTLLWSGGWDGTFRFLQLAEQPITIQPIYVIDKNRAGTEYEKKAISGILKAVKSNGGGYNLRAQILDFQYYDVEWILKECADTQISDAFKYLNEQYKVGIQYEWFALLAKYLGIKLEVGVVHQYHGKVEDAIEAEGNLSLIQDDILPGRYEVLPKGESKKVFLVFENLILPIINLTKKDEEHIATEKGWLDIMKMTWFCHSPIYGKPCGLCGPCDDAMNTGMEWRLPPEAQRRYKHRKFYTFIRKFKRRVPFLRGVNDYG